MKKLYLTLLIIVTGLTLGGLSGCVLHCVHGSGKQLTENFKFSKFSKITIAGNFKVTLKQDSSMAVKIVADDNLLKYIKTTEDGDRLHIYTKRDLCSSGEITISIGVKDLEELKASGAVDVVSDGKINVHDIRFKLTGATKITMDITAANVTTDGSGATELNLKGQASSHSIDLSGDGNIHAFDFVVGDCSIQTSGIGNSEVNVLHTLNIHSSGASDVKYKGQPTITNDKSGASSVEQVN